MKSSINRVSSYFAVASTGIAIIRDLLLSIGDIVFLFLTIIFCIVGIILLRTLFNINLSNFNTELLSSILGAILMVGAMVVMMRFQSRMEQDKEFKIILFEKKLAAFQDVLNHIFKMDDDNVITKDEVQELENKIGVACLVSRNELIEDFSSFLIQLKSYGCMYERSMDENQIHHFFDTMKKADIDFMGEAEVFDSVDAEREYYFEKFISLDNLVDGMRDDLQVFNGPPIVGDISSFINFPYNKFKLIRNPNEVD